MCVKVLKSMGAFKCNAAFWRPLLRTKLVIKFGIIYLFMSTVIVCDMFSFVICTTNKRTNANMFLTYFKTLWKFLTATVVQLSRPATPHLPIARILGSIPSMVNFMNVLFVIYHSLGVPRRDAELFVVNTMCVVAAD